MSALRCPVHDMRLVLDEVTTEERLVGGVGWESTESGAVERWACPAAGCRETRHVSGRRAA